MAWFTLVCMISGFLVGWILKFPVAVTLTSLQIVLISIALMLATDFGVAELVLWCAAGLFAHQAAYLGGVIVRSFWEEPKWNTRAAVSIKLERQLTLIQTLASRVATLTPASAREDALRCVELASEIRLTVTDRTQVEAILIEMGHGR
jgi:hypothetical protein